MHLERATHPENGAFRAHLRELGVYHCTDATRVGLALSNDEAARLRAIAEARGVAARIHPRTFLLDGRRRVAVVLDWHLPHRSCPFYAGFRCTVYDARPLVCRAYPVLAIGRAGLPDVAAGTSSSSSLDAPECPKMPVPRAQLRAESAARRALERAHAALDAIGADVLTRGGLVEGLAPREAGARLRRYRITTPEEYPSARATRSTR